MLTRARSMLLVAATVAVTGIASGIARADSVTYHTAGHFTSAGTGTGVSDSITGGGSTLTLSGTDAGGNAFTENLTYGAEANTVSLDSQTSIITLPVVGPVSVTTPVPLGTALPATFGHFSITGTDGTPLLPAPFPVISGGTAGFTGAQFELDIFQDLPAVDPSDSNEGMFLGSLTGQLSYMNGVLALSFSQPTTILIPKDGTSYPPAIFYSVDPSQTLNVDPVTNFYEVRGTVAAAPLPSTASMGISIFGGSAVFAGIAALRRRRAGILA